MQPLIAAQREFKVIKSDFPMKFGNLGTNLIKFILVPKSLRVFPLLLQFIIKEFHGIHLGLLGNLDIRLHRMVVGVAGPFHHNLGRDAAGEGESIYSEGSIPDEPKACSGSQGIEEHHCLCQSQRVRRDSGMYPFLLPVGYRAVLFLPVFA